MSREFIAQKLRELRQKSGFTADEVGEKIGKSGKTVNAWEHNHGQPDAEILIELCDIYDVDDILKEFREAPHAHKLADLNQAQLLSNYNQLNETGKARLLEYSDDLVTSGKYTIQIQKEKRA